jgi:hypothetical protein
VRACVRVSAPVAALGEHTTRVRVPLSRLRALRCAGLGVNRLAAGLCSSIGLADLRAGNKCKAHVHTRRQPVGHADAPAFGAADGRADGHAVDGHTHEGAMQHTRARAMEAVGVSRVQTDTSSRASTQAQRTHEHARTGTDVHANGEAWRPDRCADDDDGADRRADQGSNDLPDRLPNAGALRRADIGTHS